MPSHGGGAGSLVPDVGSPEDKIWPQERRDTVQDRRNRAQLEDESTVQMPTMHARADRELIGPHDIV
ncbi:hypothetical protein GCM10027290_29810 [Micromonospora sonneratiae]